MNWEKNLIPRICRLSVSLHMVSRMCASDCLWRQYFFVLCCWWILWFLALVSVADLDCVFKFEYIYFISWGRWVISRLDWGGPLPHMTVQPLGQSLFSWAVTSLLSSHLSPGQSPLSWAVTYLLGSDLSPDSDLFLGQTGHSEGSTVTPLVENRALLFTSCVTFENLLNFSKPPFHSL